MPTPSFRKKLFCEHMEHFWVVLGMIEAQRTLTVVCRNCHAVGLVTDPSEFEWERATRPPHKPYTWYFHDRVEVITCRLPAVPQNREIDRYKS